MARGAGFVVVAVAPFAVPFRAVCFAGAMAFPGLAALAGDLLVAFAAFASFSAATVAAASAAGNWCGNATSMASSIHAAFSTTKAVRATVGCNALASPCACFATRQLHSKTASRTASAADNTFSFAGSSLLDIAAFKPSQWSFVVLGAAGAGSAAGCEEVAAGCAASLLLDAGCAVAGCVAAGCAGAGSTLLMAA